MTPDMTMPDWYRPRQAPKASNMTRRQRIALRRGNSTAQPGGILKDCGCRYARAGGHWWHVTPCRTHQLAVFPLTDESMKQIGAAS